MMVSVLICVYNDELRIERAIRSCISQTGIDKDDMELIIVDDGSTDSTPQILEDVRQTYGSLFHITIVTLSVNVGLGKACNEGIRKSKGRYLVRVDSDDYVSEHFLFIESLYLRENKEIPAVACDYQLVDEEERVIGRESSIKMPIACGVMFRKDKLVSLGMYKDVRKGEDIDMFMRFVEKYGIYRIALPLYRYTIRSGSLTHQIKEEENT